MAAATRSNRLLGIILAALLAVSMLPAAGLASAFADEPAARPEVIEGDVALDNTATDVAAHTNDDGLVSDGGLLYTVTDGGLMLVGFEQPAEDAEPQSALEVPASVSVDGKDAPVVAVAIAEGNVAESVVGLTLPQSITDVDTATLAAAFPNLASVEIASPKASGAPVAAGAAAMKAAYSSFAGILYKNVRDAAESGAPATGFAKELVWAPPATVVARIPAECASIAPGAFADAKGLKTVVCFGVMGEIPQAKKAEDGTVVPGAFTDEQIATANVIVPQTGTVVPDPGGGRVSADVAVTDHSTMDVKREAWWKSGFASDRITLGEVYGSTTNTLPVTEEGTLEVAEAEVAYAPETTQNSSSRKAGIKPPESAIPTPVPDDDELDPSESGLVFTHLADMTLSVSWKGDPTATPSHIEIPAYATINGVVYPVAEIAPEAFKGAVFLASVTIPETVTTIGDSAFDDCANLTELNLPSTLRTMANTVLADASASASLALSEEDGANCLIPLQTTKPLAEGDVPIVDAMDSVPEGVSSGVLDMASMESDSIAAFAGTNSIGFNLYITGPAADAVPIQTSNGATAAPNIAKNLIRLVTAANETQSSGQLKIGTMWLPVSEDGTIGSGSSAEQVLEFRVAAADRDSGSGLLLGYMAAPNGWKFSGYGAALPNLFGTNPINTNGYISFVRDEAAGVDELALASHNHDGTYAKKGTTHTSTNLDDYALTSQIPSLSGYATQSWVNGKGYLTSSSLSGYATTDWVGKQGYLTSASLNGYATQSWVNNKGYLTGSSLNGYATQAWVGQQGYATTSSVDTKLSSYVTKTALSDYYTKTESDGRYQPKGSYAAASHNHDAAYAAKSHAHAIGDVTGLQTALDGKAPAGHTHSQYVTNQTAADTYATKSSLSAYVTTTALGTTLGSYAKKADIPSLDGYLKTADADKKYQAAGSYAAASHAHTIANVIGLQDALNGKAASNHSHDDLYYTESEVDSKLSAYVTTTALGTTLSSYLTNKTAADTYATKQTVSSLATTVSGKADKAALDALSQTVAGKADAATTTAELAKKLDASAVSKYDANQKIDDALARAQGAAEKAAADALDGAKTEINAAIADTKAELRGDIDDLAKEIAGGFGTIRYEGLDGGSDAGVYPTSYKAGGTPSLHAPSREGWDFAGWEWRRGDASGDGGNLADAFAAAGEVVLTATWAQEAPKGTYFFTERDPLMKGAPAPQEHVIKVVMTRTRSYPVDRVEFSWDNWTGLIAEGASITLTVGTDYNEATGEIRNGRSCALARDAAGANKASIEGLNMVPVQFASRQCGLYVGISVPDGAVDRVVESYTEGSYVDSLVKMSYALAG